MPVQYVEYRPKRIVNVHKKVDEGWFWDKYSASPYIGCEHACEYCYARADKYLQFDDPDDYDRVVKVKMNAPQLLRKELRNKEIDVVVCGDWQPAEDKYGLSRKMLEVVRDLRFPLHVIEKSDLLLRDLDLLEEIAGQTWCRVSYSLSTADDELARKLEPNATPPSKRLKAVRKLNMAGVKAGVAYMPIVPYITDGESHVKQTIEAAWKHGATHVLPSSMTLQNIQAERFYRWLEKYYPMLVQKYRKLYASGYAPDRKYSDRLNVAVNRICGEYKIPTRIPRPVFKKEFTKQQKLDFF